ncbi:hypothetical protein CRYUN_Cryun09bG0009200 [Craigia yunnanensis]
MKTLTSSCSKAIIDKNRDKGFSCFKDLSLSRAEVCLLTSKKLVRTRFLHLLSVQHRRLQPVFSSSSLSPDSQVDLETTETQPEEENPSKTIHVKFQLQKECSFNEHFFIVGDHPMLGLWDPESVIPLTWSEGHVWTAELDIPVGISIQFKFIIKTSTGNIVWQPDPDRIFKSWETENMIIVCEDWEEAEYQKVIEEQPLANQDGPLLDSEMTIDAENLTPPKEELVSDINLVSDTDSIIFPGKEPLQALSEELATGNSAQSLEKPLAIVADNISYPTEDFIANENNGMLCVKRTNYPIDEALVISSKNVLVAENVGNIGRVETLQNSATPDVEGNLVSHESSPVLVPGLTPLATVSTEEVMLDEDGKNSMTCASIGVNEATYHKLPKVDLETTETQPEEENPSKTIHVKFQLQKECSFGEHFFIVGDHPMLGLWDPESAIPLTWSEGHVWTVELDIPVGISIQFKFILKTSTGNLLWQPGPDRIFKSWETENMIIVCEDWEEAEYQKVIEEQPLANQDGPLLDSEMTIDAQNLTPPKEELVTGNSAQSLEKPLAIVADNISYPTEDFIANANNGVLCVKRTNYPIDEALAISSKNVLVAEDLGNIGRVETLQNPATPDVEVNLLSHEGSPVLVPGLTPLATVSTEEVMLDVDGKKSTTGASIGVNEYISQIATVC